jgi:hypothetical protein
MLPQSSTPTHSTTRRSAYVEYRQRLNEEACYEQQVRQAEQRQQRRDAALAETAAFLGGIFDGDQLFA